MKLYDEFFAIIKAFESDDITYAVIGGAALAFHDKPRFTRDIDTLIKQGPLKTVTKLLKYLNFFESTDPHQFLKINLVLHRFLKTKDNDHLILDILMGEDDIFNKIFEKAIKKGGLKATLQ